MRSRVFGVLLTLAACCCFAAPTLANESANATITEHTADPKATEVIGLFIAAFGESDEDARWKAVFPLMHSSTFNRDGTEVHSNFKRLIGRKASAITGAQSPPKIDKVERMTYPEDKPFSAGQLRATVVDRYVVAGNGGSFKVMIYTEDGVPRIINVQ